MKLKVYYAHPMYLYNTPQEKRDIEILEKMGFEVINPNSEPYISEYKIEIEAGRHNMDYWNKLALSCDILAFRSLPDGSILSGVGSEILCCMNEKRPIIELPSMIKKRIIKDVEITRGYLSEIGQR